MRYRIDYTPTEDFPYVPKDVLATRLEAKLSPAGPGGCRLWQGAVRKRADHGPCVGTLRLKGPGGSFLVNAPQVAWFLAGHRWPSENQWMRRICGQSLCCAPEHLELCEKLDRRKLTTDQVLEARQLFWSTHGRRRDLMARLPERLVQDELGLDMSLVRQVVAGEAVTAVWSARGITAERVRSAYDHHAKTTCSERRAKYVAAWTYQRLADRYGISLATVQAVLCGRAYREVGGPTGRLPAAADASGMAQAS